MYLGYKNPFIVKVAFSLMLLCCWCRTSHLAAVGRVRVQRVCATPSQQSAQSRITFVTCMRARRRRREVGGDNARSCLRTANCCQRGLKELKSSGEWKRWLAYKFRDLIAILPRPGHRGDKAQTPGTVPAIPGRLATMLSPRASVNTHSLCCVSLRPCVVDSLGLYRNVMCLVSLYSVYKASQSSFYAITIFRILHLLVDLE